MPAVSENRKMNRRGQITSYSSRRTSLRLVRASRRLALLLQLVPLLLQHRFPAQLDLVAFERQHLHQNLIALFQLIADGFNPILRDLADVQQTIGAGEYLDERAELHQPNHLAEIGLSNFGD